MVKKELIVCIFLVLLLVPFVSAANETNIDEAYDCLDNEIDEKTCSEMSFDEQVFSFLATGDCINHIANSSEIQDQEECWTGGASDCQVDATAKAILALDKDGEDTTNAINWLTSQNKTPDELRWYLQIQSSEKPATCEITYDQNTYTTEINKDDTLSSEAGDCLILSDSGYWLTISPDCYGLEFEISCNSSFSTNLLFKEEDSSTINVLDKTSSASSGGTTKEEVNALCLKEGGICSYEGTLWGSIVLSYFDKDVSKYLPYLISLKDNYRQYIPSSFIYELTGNVQYANELMNQRSPAGYWEKSGDRYYDTALAMNFLKGSDIQGLTETEDWLTEQQDDDGCWDNRNIRNTAFVLYSTWPRTVSSGSGPESDTICTDVADCVYSDECSDGGEELPEYSDTCPGNKICCDMSDVEDNQSTCEELAGEEDFEICDGDDEYCSGGEEKPAASDIMSWEICCVGGTCEVSEEDDNDTNGEEDDNCEEEGGTCRVFDCQDGEEESTTYSCSGGDTCCMPAEERGGEVSLWVWILIVLIVLVALGIIFKDKLKEWWLKIKSGKGRGGGRGRPRSGPRGPGGRPPGYPPRRPPQGQNVQRRIMPRQQPQQRPPQQRPKRGSKELDNVLGKLKEMGK